MPLYLTAAAAGLLVGLAYILAQRGALEPSTLALVGLVVILLGQCITPYFSPFGVGLLLGLSYDTFEEDWYGSAVARSARCSYRARLFLKTLAVWARRHLGNGESSLKAGRGPRRRLPREAALDETIRQSFPASVRRPLIRIPTAIPSSTPRRVSEVIDEAESTTDHSISKRRPSSLEPAVSDTRQLVPLVRTTAAPTVD
jgi:xanthosine utilization system XapX-like protein